MNLLEYYEIGTVIRSIGLQGKIKILFKQKYKELTNGEALFFSLENQMIPHFIQEIIWESEQIGLVLLEDLNHKEAADKLVKQHVFVNKIFIEKKVKSNSDFIFLKYDVLDFEKNVIGKIIGYLDMGDYFLIEVENTTKKFLLPLHPDLIIEKNDSQKWICLKISDGLLDL